MLPPGVDAKTFAAALAAFKEAVGEQYVYTSEEDLDTYRDPYSLRWGLPGELLASAAVAPDNVEEVQKIVKIANRYKYSALSDIHGQEPDLWRCLADLFGQRGARSEADESRHQGRRQA